MFPTLAVNKNEMLGYANLERWRRLMLGQTVNGTDIAPWTPMKSRHDLLLKSLRILVCADAGFGKSTLTNQVFGVADYEQVTSTSHRKPGEHNINEEIIHPGREVLILHDSKGCETGTEAQIQAVEDFLERGVAVTLYRNGFMLSGLDADFHAYIGMRSQNPGHTPYSHNVINIKYQESAFDMAHHEPRSYDLIIVGAGTPGCVLANRLSEDPNISILVLEAGEDRNNDARIYTPGLAGSVLNNPDFDWQYISEPDAGINDRFSGILYSQHGVLHKVVAKRDVILAAGAFNTPQILELSGIGNPSILEQHGINVIHANPTVGENLQDHIRAWVSFEVTDDFPLLTKPPIKEARKLYEEHRSGPLTQNGAYMFSYTPLAPFLDSAESEKLNKILDQHFDDDERNSPFTRKRNNVIRKTIESADEATAVTFLSTKAQVGSENGRFVTLNSMLSHPFSAGNVHITSTDPESAPKIDFKYYSHPVDSEIHARHVKVLEQLANTEPLASYIRPRGRRLPEGYTTDTLTNAKEIARDHAMTNYHPCGTCSLGSVVDSHLNVKGVRNLRIVDASIIPIIPRGNILATVYAVAEHGADIISEDLGLRRST
ncbi:unnamed protein product [Aureobasidium vineae]|uniref:Glucose-methanol-choline oxidoreductase N-terminal domain-containing protein n=1 Tax=Aureobasidium vineae TaxID=2773715 RepID=A0A9N8JWS5_9PEZI|nr:unnamed protein product [Aureobasidium vineae]